VGVSERERARTDVVRTNDDDDDSLYFWARAGNDGHVCVHTRMRVRMHTHTHTLSLSLSLSCNGGTVSFASGVTSSQGVSSQGEHLEIAEAAEVQDLLQRCHEILAHRNHV